MNRRCLLISPGRNEAKYMRHTLDSGKILWDALGRLLLSVPPAALASYEG
jgi:hypothetical protein